MNYKNENGTKNLSSNTGSILYPGYASSIISGSTSLSGESSSGSNPNSKYTNSTTVQQQQQQSDYEKYLIDSNTNTVKTDSDGMNFKSMLNDILPSDNYNSPYFCVFDSNSSKPKPIDLLINRFTIWKMILKHLIFYLKEIGIFKQQTYLGNKAMIQNLELLSKQSNGKYSKFTSKLTGNSRNSSANLSNLSNSNNYQNFNYSTNNLPSSSSLFVLVLLT
ncbi:hypothetical protein B5S29_g5760 [[Candida] boidinii]|nr:hypothetical protein B5S29_g5760 [[Candida] boidinii]